MTLAVASGDHTAGFTARAESICQTTQTSLSGTPQPKTVSDAVAREQSILGSYASEVRQLKTLQPPSDLATPYRAGVADDQALLRMLASMLRRPDYVRLAVTLPGHPQRVPAWLKRWVARSHALVADARARFTQAELPTCAKALR